MTSLSRSRRQVGRHVHPTSPPHRPSYASGIYVPAHGPVRLRIGTASYASSVASARGMRPVPTDPSLDPRPESLNTFVRAAATNSHDWPLRSRVSVSTPWDDEIR
jgi:hypothetical protein